jgi:hypothetical protein
VTIPKRNTYVQNCGYLSTALVHSVALIAKPGTGRVIKQFHPIHVSSIRSILVLSFHFLVTHLAYFPVGFHQNTIDRSCSCKTVTHPSNMTSLPLYLFKTQTSSSYMTSICTFPIYLKPWLKIFEDGINGAWSTHGRDGKWTHNCERETWWKHAVLSINDRIVWRSLIQTIWKVWTAFIFLSTGTSGCILWTR